MKHSAFKKATNLKNHSILMQAKNDDTYDSVKKRCKVSLSRSRFTPPTHTHLTINSFAFLPCRHLFCLSLQIKIYTQYIFWKIPQNKGIRKQHPRETQCS